MSTIQIGFIIISILFIFMLMRMPIAVAMGISGFIGLLFLGNSVPQAANIIGANAFTSANSYEMVIIPIFVLMGELSFASGLSTEAYNAANKLVGHLPGGLAMATVGGCAGFAAVSGSSVATASTMATVALPQMRQAGYDDSLACGAIAAGGTLGILIPPSTCFVVYGIITEQPIGDLLISGIFPGILLTLLFMIIILFTALRNPKLYPFSPRRATWKEMSVSVGQAWAVGILFLIVIGGIYLGICTPTEAASIGAFTAFIIALTRRRLTWKALNKSITGMIVTTGMIFLIMIGAKVFGVFFAITRMPEMLAVFINSMAAPNWAVMAIILFIFLILGCVMDTWAVMLLLVPVLVPSIKAMGFDLIWFGVLMVIMVEAGLITPPIGINVFVIGGIASDVSLYTIFRGVAPFVLAMVVCVIILIIFPQIALFLPGLKM